MIDIHTHILPDLDDGPADMDTSVGMGLIAAAEGFTAIISTSHSEQAAIEGHERLSMRLDDVRDAWSKAGLNIRLELGMEIFLRPNTLDQLKAGHLWALAGSRYLLVELPLQPWPTYADDTLYGLQLAGYVPVLAHPERYTAIQSDPGKMYELAERGILGQVTAAAVIGEHGTSIKKCSEMLLRHNLVQFIATDAHSTGRRHPRIAEARAYAETMVGPELAADMVQGNPARILAHEAISLDPQPVAPRKSFFGSLFSR
ncbi:MAG: CpsB/CapC family capsule biosynthesis tyrosine phosphatase [Chloroflexota bacterium]